jgi:hypothetical protein
MFRAAAIVEDDKPGLYRSLGEQVSALLAGERDPIANAANICALLFDVSGNRECNSRTLIQSIPTQARHPAYP